MREACQGSKEASKTTWTATNKSREQDDQTSLGRTRVVAEGAARRREAGQQMCGQEAKCVEQGKMTEAVRVERQEDKFETGGELGAGERGCFKPGEGKMYLAGP